MTKFVQSLFLALDKLRAYRDVSNDQSLCIAVFENGKFREVWN